jgi:hypothetical protein
MSADLMGADLRGANLMSADLMGADLMDANGDRKHVRSIFVSEVYPITYTATHIQIGCEQHPIEKWWEFDDKRILEMDGKTALKFWRECKEFIKTTVEKFPATPTGKEGDK